MNRRALLLAGATLPLTRTLARATENPNPARWRRFEVTTRVALPASAGAARLWLPLPQTAAGYQTTLDVRWQGTGTHEVVHDATHGAAILFSQWTAAATERKIEVVQTVATRDREPLPFVPLTEAERRFWTAPTASVPTDGIVRATAERIVAGQPTPRGRIRALYDWVVDTTWRDPKTPGCGLGDVKSMLETQQFGGKCADINSLMVGLARALGFPARDIYGIRVADSRQFPSIGKSGDITKAQHCRAEVFLEDAGWFPVDPADVRKVVLEQKLPIDHPDVRALRERLFGFWEMNWIGYNSATDIALPGSDGHQPNFAFLMYPCAFTAAGQPDTLNPAAFAYDIASREIGG
jgi:transglutaminase-like putative cysteine protease